MATERQFFSEGAQLDTRDGPTEFMSAGVQINEDTQAAVVGAQTMPVISDAGIHNAVFHGLVMTGGQG